ncbi:MAG: hypothetical protein QXH91_06935 [Candidatus Bathyarchaeia archaeon]
MIVVDSPQMNYKVGKQCPAIGLPIYVDGGEIFSDFRQRCDRFNRICPEGSGVWSAT